MKSRAIQPRIIIHGGAGHITRENLPPALEQEYREALLKIVNEANGLLSQPGASALDVATHAVVLLENNAMFNSGKGVVFTRAGTNELEASVMVSRNSRKRGVGVMRLTKVKNPIKLAREMLLRGEALDGDGASTHCQIAGESAEHLAEKWGLDIVKPSYFWTRKRWEEHRRGIGKSHDVEIFQDAVKKADTEIAEAALGYAGEPSHDICIESISWNGRDYLPQGTVGAVVLDSTGTICAATSTGGITNKVPGRIGDTPTLGAGFWCEQWTAPRRSPNLETTIYHNITNIFSSCLSRLPGYALLATEAEAARATHLRAVGMSGTGSGDSFLRVNAVRTAAAIARLSSVSLRSAVDAVAGPNGLLQQSAGEHWKKTGEGEGGIIGIEYDSELAAGSVVFNFNCGGMFRAWIDDTGRAHASAFR